VLPAVTEASRNEATVLVCWVSHHNRHDNHYLVT